MIERDARREVGARSESVNCSAVRAPRAAVHIFARPCPYAGARRSRQMRRGDRPGYISGCDGQPMNESSPPAGELVSFPVTEGVRVSARLELPPAARACYVLAHGAGAGMDHPFMSSIARELSLRGIA